MSISRRSLVTTAAALPALAASALAAGDPCGDAELLRLGELLEPIERDQRQELALDDAARRGERDDDDPDSVRWDALNSRAFPLVNRILAHKAETVAGLRVQTRALQLTNNDLWYPLPGLDDSDRIPGYFRSVCNVLGLPLPRSAYIEVRS
jgi:hypothetical protein